MKTMLLALIASLLAIGTTAVDTDETNPIPAWYYNSPCQQPEGVDLYDWLVNLEQPGELEPGGWDCSQASAHVEWLAENCGYDTVFTCLFPPGEDGHCWVTIEDQHFETMGLYWVSDIDPYVLNANKVFEDIHKAWAFSDQLHEWGWWITYPELRG